MSFTRTETGVANYNLFFGTDLVVFIEGRPLEICSVEEMAADESFYKALLSKILPNKTIKIKCVGNCDDVVAHVQKLVDVGSTSGFGIIDRDSAGILYSITNTSKQIMTTKGYSWENDLWSEQTIWKSSTRLILAKDDLHERVKLAVSRGMRRLSLLCRLDFASRIHESALFKKNGKACGIGFDGRKSWVVPLNEISRFIKKYRGSPAYSCALSKRIMDSTKYFFADSLVQGHLKHSMVCNVIASTFQSVYKKTNVGHTVILNTALSVFSENPRESLGDDTYKYYEQMIGKMYQG